MQALVETHFHRGQIVVPAAERQAGSRYAGIGLGKQPQNFAGRHGGLRIQSTELGRNLYRPVGIPRIGEERIRTQPTASAMGVPLVFQQSGFGIYIAIRRGIGRTGCIGTMLRIGAVVILRPEPMQYKCRMRGALLSIRV